MARVIQRHWKLILVQLGLIVLIVGLTVPMLMQTEQAVGQQSSSTAVELSPQAYHYIQALRKDIRLAERDLAAMGCSQAEAEELLQTVVAWYQANESTIQSEREAVRQGRNQMRLLQRKMNVGPRDERVIAQYETTQAGLARHYDARFNRQQSLIETVRGLMTQSQKSIHDAAMHNGSLPGNLKYVAGLTADQKAEVMRVVRQVSRTKADIQAVLNRELTASQKRLCDQADANVRACLAGVRRAENAVMPKPQATQ